MKLADPEITNLRNQIEGWSEEITIIDLQYQAATDVALKFAQQLDSLHSKHRTRSFNLNQTYSVLKNPSAGVHKILMPVYLT